MLYHAYAKGKIFKNADLTFGLFTPSLQEGFVGNARTKGLALEYKTGATTIKAYNGNLHEKVADLSSPWSDAFRRHGDRGDFALVPTDSNGNYTDSSYNGETGFYSQRLQAYGFSVESDLTKTTKGGIGYYNLYSPVAYGKSHLSILAANVRQKLFKNVELVGFYSHGNQHYQNKAYDAKLVFNGSPWGDKKIGGSIGYRYLGSDAIIMSSVVNGSEKPGRKGFEASLWFHITKNIQLQNYIFNGLAINKKYDNAGTHRTAYFSNLLFSF